MCFASPSAPKAPIQTDQSIEQPIDAAGQKANETLRKRLRAMSGYTSTSLTGGSGVQGVASVGKTTLGA